jgi:hypothetical protein
VIKNTIPGYALLWQISLNNIDLHDVAAVGNVGGGHAINNDHRDVAVVNNVGNTEFINDSCGTGPDINIGNWTGMVDIVAAINSEPCDVAILQQQRTFLQQPEIFGNTNINNENEDHVGDDSVDNATRWEVGVGHMQSRENPHTGPQITTRTGTGKVAGYNELGTEECLGVASVPTITYLWRQLTLRDAKIVALEQRLSQLSDAVKDLQDRLWQPMLFIKTVERQRQIKPLGSYTMSQQENHEGWGCTLPANNNSWFSSGKDDEGVLEEENEDEDKRDEGNNWIWHQEMDDRNNIMLPHPRQGGLEGGR